MKGFRKGLVKIDSPEFTEIFECYFREKSENWNGWAVPYFTRETLEKVFKANEDVIYKWQFETLTNPEWSVAWYDNDGELHLTHSENGILEFSNAWVWIEIGSILQAHWEWDHVEHQWVVNIKNIETQKEWAVFENEKEKPCVDLVTTLNEAFRVLK